MSKKTLLNEATIRRFGGLAGIRPIITSNFLTEVEVGEEELADALAAGAEAMADTLGLPVSVDVEAGESEEGEEEFDLEGGEEEEEFDLEGGEEIEGEEEFGVEAGGEEIEGEEEEETLDELIGRILQEEDDEEDLEEEQDYGGDEGDESRSRRDYSEGGKKGDESRSRRDYSERQKAGGNKGDESRSRRDYSEGGKKGDESESRRDYKEHRGGEGGSAGQHSHGRGTGAEDARFEGLRVLDDEYLMKEVSRRVKHRLAKLVKEQRRRKRLSKRQK